MCRLISLLSAQSSPRRYRLVNLLIGLQLVKAAKNILNSSLKLIERHTHKMHFYTLTVRGKSRIKISKAKEESRRGNEVTDLVIGRCTGTKDRLKYIKKTRERWEKIFSRVSLSLHPLNSSAAANSDLSRCGRRFPISGHRGWWARHSVQAALLSFSPPCTVLLVLMELFHRIFVVCARIWVRSEIRDPIEPLKGRYRHAPASSSRSSRSPLSVRPKPQVYTSSSVEIARVWFCRRPPPVELREVSQPPPSMPAWSHFGECSTDPTLQLFFLSQQVCSGLSNKVLVRDP
ncbi:hypothetical protein DY000_02003515 [Brassica cretica]|uniref:Uncharacterized protein n=1 Tax=Brassica cretica TaxID=69181 RepID=A0ABQ7BUY0_BRACR|nr:hypothetical protein DY000_02003515 [Brassica cretica]